jgi:hypothetical protein
VDRQQIQLGLMLIELRDLLSALPRMCVQVKLDASKSASTRGTRRKQSNVLSNCHGASRCSKAQAHNRRTVLSSMSLLFLPRSVPTRHGEQGWQPSRGEKT